MACARPHSSAVQASSSSCRNLRIVPPPRAKPRRGATDERGERRVLSRLRPQHDTRRLFAAFAQPSPDKKCSGHDATSASLRVTTRHLAK